MELGGNAPFIVFADANVNMAVEGLISSKFRSSGQTCVCANRIFIHSSIIDSFATKLSGKIAQTFHFGSVWDKRVNYGPLYSAKALEKVQAQVEDALSKGARVYSGSVLDNDAAAGPNFYPPRVIVGATTAMRFMEEETFGPVAFLVPFETEDEVVALANSTNAGLAAYFLPRISLACIA
ncbi:unnamed protein product [Parascedosporium putredinis]|uniref:Succinate-semialdehyde dehydrogenase, mitochondrial n=1 Tax=Parascedosporium putredinis TaxID=1442378 RepID=A0A9P1H3B9_9PEZI|nr:unnamed protein product [Parascedosporium putredinis]CAI7996844.1 unnamed protein product [Parascedosporium putredinis]